MNRPLFTSKFKNIFLLIGILPVLLYGYVIFQFSSNVPFYDDFFWGFQYLETYLEKNSFFDKVNAVFVQHNQHRFIYFRSILVMAFHLEGYLNFKHLILVGNLSVLGIFLTYLAAYKQVSVSWLFFLPMPFILFQFQFMHNSIISYGLPNMSIIFLAILTFYLACFIDKNKIYLVWIVGFIATFSNGNGIVVFGVVIILLVLQQRLQQAVYTTLLYALSLFIYFWDFKMNTQEIKLDTDTLLYVFKFLGASFFLELNTFAIVLAIIAFISLFIYFGLVLFKFVKSRYQPITDKVVLFCLGVFIFLVLTALMTALIRSIHKIGIPDWYKNYSIIFVLTFYVLLLNFKKSYSAQICLFFVTFAYSLTIWYMSATTNLTTYQYVKSTLEADVINFQKHGYWAFHPAQEGLATYEKHNRLTGDFIKKGYYRFPVTPLSNQLFDEKECKKVIFTIKKSPELFANVITYDLENPTVNDRKFKDRYGFIVNASTRQYYFFGLTPIFNGVKGLITYKSLFFDRGSFGVNERYFKHAIPEGEYYPGMVFIDKNNKAEWKISDQRIIVDNY